MKKSVRIFILLIILAFSFTLFAFSRPTNDVISARYENVATNGRFEVCAGNSGDSAVFRFESETEINTVVLTIEVEDTVNNGVNMVFPCN